MSSDEALAAQPSLANLPGDILEDLVALLGQEDQLNCLLVCKPWCAATQAAACKGTLTLRHPGSNQTDGVDARLEAQLHLLRAFSSRVKSLKLEQPHAQLLPTILQAVPTLETLTIQGLLSVLSMSEVAHRETQPAPLAALHTMELQGCFPLGSSLARLAAATALTEISIDQHTTQAADLANAAKSVVEALPLLCSVVSLHVDVDFAVLGRTGKVSAAVGQLTNLQALRLTLRPNVDEYLWDGNIDDPLVFKPGILHPARHWQGLQQLTDLVLGCDLYTITADEGLGSLGALQQLELELADDEFCPTDVWRHRGLKKLQINGGWLDSWAGCDLPALTHLRLISCEPTAANWAAALPTRELVELTITSMPLYDAAAAILASMLAQVCKLQILVLDFAGLCVLPEPLTQLCSLRQLSLRGNELVTLPPGPYLKNVILLNLGEQGSANSPPTLPSIPWFWQLPLPSSTLGCTRPLMMRWHLGH